MDITVVLSTRWDNEHCVASAELLFFRGDSPCLVSLTIRSPHHLGIVNGVYGPVADVVRQVEDRTIQEMKDTIAELCEAHTIEWLDDITREPPNTDS